MQGGTIQVNTTERQEIVTRFFESIPHSRALGMRIVSVGAARATISMPYDRRLIGDPVSGVIHGGAVSALVDTCAGAAVALHPEILPPVATLNLNVAYMRPAAPGATITATAECHHFTRTVAFVRVSAYDGDDHRPLATATGQFAMGTSRQ